MMRFNPYGNENFLVFIIAISLYFTWTI